MRDFAVSLMEQSELRDYIAESRTFQKVAGDFMVAFTIRLDMIVKRMDETNGRVAKVEGVANVLMQEDHTRREVEKGVEAAEMRHAVALREITERAEAAIKEAAEKQSSFYKKWVDPSMQKITVIIAVGVFAFIVGNLSGIISTIQKIIHP